MTGLQRKYAEVSGRSLSDYINESDGRSFLGVFIPWLLIKQSKGSWGRLFLFLLVDIGVVALVVFIIAGMVH